MGKGCLALRGGAKKQRCIIRRNQRAGLIKACLLPVVAALITIAPAASAQHLNFKNYTVADGLPQSQVLAVFQDSRGYIWVGTLGGAACYNGIEFVCYDNTDGLRGNIITEFAEDSAGRIFISA
jgi:ligand-binding sensor domain-containing protein